MAYTKQTWADLPSKTTPINAERLTHIEDGIFNAAQTADTAASTAGTAAANVGIVSGKVETLTERVNGLDTAVSNKVDKVAGKGLSTNDYDDTDKGKVDSLGTASTKNSTSVVTSSSDLVESGAVYDAVESAYQLNKDTVGWSGKNQLDITESITSPQHTVTIAVNSNKSISFNNTADAQFYFYINRNVVLDENEKYILSGVSPNQYGCKLQIYDNTHSAWIDGGDTGDGFIITGYSNIRVAVVIPKNAVMDDVTWYPMIRRANIIDPTYEPYHASVSDSLLDKCDNSVIGTVEDGTNPTKAYAVGEHMVRGGKFCTVTSPVTTSSTWTLGSNYVEGDVASELTYYETSISISDVQLFSSLATNIVCKSGNIKQIVFHGVINTEKTVSAWSSFGTIPSGYRPKTAQFLYARLTKSNSDVHFARLQIGTNGAVSLDEALEAGDRLIVNATYIL